MRYVVTAEEMKYYDNHTIEKITIPSLLLMERAAMEMTNVLCGKIKAGDKILILAGGGNNGGDALAVGRLLSEKGMEVCFWMPLGVGKTSEETGRQITVLKNLGFSIHDNFPEGEYDIIIDGLFGIGLTRDIEGVCAKAIEKVNALRARGAMVAAVDIPSGICADTGKVMGCAVKADVTVTFEYAKAGHYFYPGREYAGELFVRPIGISRPEIAERFPGYMTADREELSALLPARRPDGNKGSFGKVLLFAGSKDMCGAAILCGRAIFAAGAGMVKIMTHETNRVVLQKSLPEAMLFTYETLPDKERLEEVLSWADVIVAGPGIGVSSETAEIMEQLLAQGEKSFVADADGLNLIAEDEALQKAVLAYTNGKLVMTPHPGELMRLLGKSMPEYKANPVKSVQEAAQRFQCIVTGKDAVTLIASHKEKVMFLNHTGNDGMAVAGSGDVLAGIIGGLLAQGQEPFKAAMTGVLAHGAAGDKAASKKSRYAMTASDITESLYEILKEAEEKRSFS